MIRHVVMFRWKEGVGHDHAARTAAALQTLPAQIPQLVGYHVGADIGISGGNFDFAVVAEVATTDDFVIYRDHPTHQAVIKEFIAPNIAERVAVQFSAD
jgi:hypothetical protein